MSETIRGGGLAFPPNAGWREDDPACRGMTLRDWFAGQALAGLTANMNRQEFVEMSTQHMASLAYRYADAMLRARTTDGDAS